MEQVLRDAIQSGRTDIEQSSSYDGGYYVPGDLINPYFSSHCAYCGQKGPDSSKHLLCCSRCHEIFYCSKSCQVSSWKAIHKTYCKRHSQASIGRLSMENLNNAQHLSQLTVTLREHEGLDKAIESAMGQVLIDNDRRLVETASISDLKSLARVTARRMNRKDPSQLGDAMGLFIIVSAMSTLATVDIDVALADTPLFKCVARFYLHYANVTLSTHQPHDILDIPLLSAVVNLVHPKLKEPTVSAKGTTHTNEDLLTRCIDATWNAVADCQVIVANARQEKEAQEQQQQQLQLTQNNTTEGISDSTSNSSTALTTTNKGKGNNKKNKKNKNKQKKMLTKQSSPPLLLPKETTTTNYQILQKYAHHLQTQTLPNLRMLARNLHFIGALPTRGVVDKIPRIVLADFLTSVPPGDHDSIQVWCTTAQNMVQQAEQYQQQQQQQQHAKGDTTNNTEPSNTNNSIQASRHPENGGDETTTTTTTDDNCDDDDDDIQHIAKVGHALFPIIQECGSLKLGVDIVFHNHEGKPGESHYRYE